MSMMLHGARLPWPTDWEAQFGRAAPLLMEIGFGGGHFLVALARKRPSANMLGVEISLPSLRRGESKARQADLGNVRLVQGNARLVLQATCVPGSISELYINFPDPWPKEKHHHRRLITDQFLHLAATRLAVGGRLDIATDHADYAAWIAERLEHTPYFTSRRPTTFVTSDDTRLRTKYEQIAVAEGRTCHYFQWQRNDAPAAAAFPIPEELPMPHVVLRTPLSLAEIGRQFRPDHVSAGDVHVRLMEAYHSFYDQKLLVEAYVNEEPLRQRVGLSVRRRETGDLVVGLHEIGFPRPTAGIQLAIAQLASWVLGLHPDAELVTSNISDLFQPS